MGRVKLDNIDLSILRDLQASGRMTNVDLARRAKISAPPCLRRVRALEKSGVIRGYHADIDGEMLGYGVTVFAQVGLKSQADKLNVGVFRSEFSQQSCFIHAVGTPRAHDIKHQPLFSKRVKPVI